MPAGSPFRHSLQWRLPLLVSALVIVVLGVFVWVSYDQVEAALIDDGLTRAKSAAVQLASMTGQSPRQRMADLRRIAADPAVLAYLTSPSDDRRQAAESAVRAFASNPTQVVQVFGAAHNLLLSVANPAAAAAALGSPAPPQGPGLTMDAGPNHVIVADITETVGGGRQSSAPLGYITVRRAGVTGQSPDALSQLIGGGALVQLGGRTGSWTDLKNIVAAPPLGPDHIGSAQYRSAAGDWRLGGWAELAGTPYILWVDFPLRGTLAPARAYLFRLALLGLAFAVLAAGISRTVIGRVTRPLSALAETAEAIAAGDYTRRAQTDRTDEIGRLGSAFNTMINHMLDAHRVLQLRVTERERALEALTESEARHHATVDVALDCIITIDHHGRITEFNRAAERTFGYTRADVMGREMADLIVPPKYREAHRRGLARYLVTQQGPVIGRLMEITGMRADGTEFPIELAVQAVHLDGQPMFTAYLRDITARRLAEQARMRGVELEAENRRVREATRLKSEFLANMSHELRTPLNAVIGFSSILHDGRVGRDDAQYREFAGHILTAGRHLLQLINDVLDLSKVEAGKVEFRPEPVELDLVVDEVLAILRAAAAEKSITIRVQIADEARLVVLDPGRLKQVLYNYLSNAIKFTPPEGTIDVRATVEDPDMIRIEVADTGIGIAEADVFRLFQEFQQLESGAAEQHGTGLGLALTKRIVEAQGGSVGVRSMLGAGSVFHAILPRVHVVESHDPVCAPAEPAREPSATAPSILVIEDHDGDRARIVEVLSNAGYHVEAARTGTEALAMCRARVFDAVTLDLLLPDQSGLDVLQKIRETGRNPTVPVIVVTVIADEPVLAGHVVSDLLPKPVDSDTLLLSLRRAGIAPRTGDRILAVDDDQPSLGLLAVTLEQAGYAVEAHSDPTAALASAEDAPPAAVVLDLLMPKLNGFEFIDALRAQPANETTPVIVWTVKDLSRQERRQLAESARGVLQKGQGNVDTLLRELRGVLAPAVPPADPHVIEPHSRR